MYLGGWENHTVLGSGWTVFDGQFLSGLVDRLNGYAIERRTVESGASMGETIARIVPNELGKRVWNPSFFDK